MLRITIGINPRSLELSKNFLLTVRPDSDGNLLIELQTLAVLVTPSVLKTGCAPLRAPNTQ